jgi:hypothetical protein
LAKKNVTAEQLEQQRTARRDALAAALEARAARQMQTFRRRRKSRGVLAGRT